MANRKFKEGLQKIGGSAARVRESVSAAIRESSVKLQQQSVEPIDYETFVLKNKTLLHNDPQREMLNFPHDDVSPSVLPRRLRTTIPSVPANAVSEVSSLLVRECIHSYTSPWALVHYKYYDYSRGYQHLPLTEVHPPLPEHVFEIDEEADEKDGESMLSRSNSTVITKKGWLYKGPEGKEKENIISFTRQFKRRYFVLQQQADATYILQFYKDDRKLEAKGAIFLDSAQGIQRNIKRGKFCFEVRMQDGQPYLFAADNETEMDDWMYTLKTAIAAMETGSQTSFQSARESDSEVTPSDKISNKKENIHPELVKYSRENESNLSKARQESRQKLFSVYPDVQHHIDLMDDDSDVDDSDPYKESLGGRYLLKLEEFKLRLQASLSEGTSTEKTANPEPFFLTFALYDAQLGKKISEDFHIDPNTPEIRGMIPADILHASDRLHSVEGKSSSSPALVGISEDWLNKAQRQAILSVSQPGPDIYLFARIDKVLQGGISHCVEPYIKSSDVKMGTKIHKAMKQYCSHIGHYRMPFGWAARPLFRQFSKGVDNFTDFIIYRQESGKMCEEEVIKHLQDLRKPEKQSKWQVIPGTFKVTVEEVPDQITDTVTSSFVPVRPFTATPSGAPTVEVAEFMSDMTRSGMPYTCYVNQLYIYPLALKYDNQKSFPKARNISCCVEIRDSDAEGAVPLKRIYGRPGVSVFTTTASTSVLHHTGTPDFVEEVKIALPTQLNDRHHLLFHFYHISCETSKTGVRNSGAGNRNSSSASLRKKDNIESHVGYSWLPLLNQGRVVSGLQNMPVASNLPNGYLAYDLHLASRPISGPDVKWVESGKPLFKVDIKLLSTTYTTDQHLHNFFHHCQKMESSVSPLNDLTSLDAETINKLKSLHAVDVRTLIHFLPTLLNQLFRLLPQTSSEQVSINAVRALTHVVSEVDGAKRADTLKTYVKYVFETVSGPSDTKHPRTVHEELVKTLTLILRPGNTDQIVIQRFLQHAWFFCDIIVKSMAQYLLKTGRIKMPRNERFPSDYQYRIQNMLQYLVPHITQKYQEWPRETQSANTSIANFVKGCFTYMDRGLIFRMINMYLESFQMQPTKVVHNYKFEFLKIICSHEHYIPLCLPLMRRGAIKTYKDLRHDYTLSDEFRKNHYLVGLLLQELRATLGEPREVRRSAIIVVRDLLAKHAFDKRYSSKSQQGRCASLYLPLIAILLENKNRLNKEDDSPRKSLGGNSTITDDIDTISTSGTITPSQPSGTPHIRHPSQRDSALFAIIAGQSSQPSPGGVQAENKSTENPNNSLTTSANSLVNGDDKPHEKHVSLRLPPLPPPSTPSSSPLIPRYNKLDVVEIRDLLVCLLYVIKNVPEEVLLGWFNNSSEPEIIEFFDLLEICLQKFRYVGRRKIFTLSVIGDTGTRRKAMTLPPRRPASSSVTTRSLSQYNDTPVDDIRSHVATSSEAGGVQRALQEANMSTEVGLIILDTLCLFSQTFKKQLEMSGGGDGPVMKRVFSLHLEFLRISVSEVLQRHAFAAWRLFISKFPSVLFKGNAILCGDLCYQILHCCNSRLSSTRRQACALLYLLMKSNFEWSKKTGFTRVHLQVIISVSQLIGDVVGLSNSRFQESLALINSYASSDRAMQKSSFPGEVKDLTKRVRTVLMATAQMREHENDPEMLIDLQYSLAKSYASTPELRKTWLHTMARNHTRNESHSEAAHCYIHIAALIAEYLKRRGSIPGSYPAGCSAFARISHNVEPEESGIKDDSGMQDVQYNEDTLVEYLELASNALIQAERYEVLGDISKLVIPIYEHKRDFHKLSMTYSELHNAYDQVVDVMRTGKRLLGQYFRVAFFGQAFFEEEDGKQYVYKEPKVTSLAELCTRLERMYSQKYGTDNIHLIRDSKKVNNSELDSKLAYIQVTYATPYFTEEELKQRPTEFERSNNVRKFMFETPFTKVGKTRGDVNEQYKLRTILTTSHTFPYVKKRILITSQREVEMSPLEVAIDEMQTRVQELQQIVAADIPDFKKLQLKLEGCVRVTVNSGPLAYAEAFLAKENAVKCSPNGISLLKNVFRQFVEICHEALELNSSLIALDQANYHETLRTGFHNVLTKLEEIFQEKLLTDDYSPPTTRNSIMVFNVTNNPAPVTTSTA